jgi:hypothetical protein
MSLKSTQNFLLSLENKNLSEVFSKLVFSGLKFEVLNPTELKGNWSQVSFVSNDKNAQNKEIQNKINTLDFIISQNQKKGFFSIFTDNRAEGSKEDLKEARENQKSLLNIAQKLQRQSELEIEKISLQEFLNNHQDKKVLFGKNLEEFKSDFENGIGKLKSKGKITNINNYDIEVFELNNIDAIIFSEESLEAVKIFVKEESYTKIELLTSKQLFLNLDEEYTKNTEFLNQNEAKGSINNLNSEILKQISALHANLELDLKSKQCINNVFSLNKDNSAKFAFINVSDDEVDKTVKILQDLEISYQKTDWNQEIYDWGNNTGLRAFQSVAQSIGTIDKKETDPTNILAIFFMIFFAFCLSDALYGLILALFTGYFLFFTKIKESFRNMFSLFFYSGLTTVIFGVLTNSWAGDFFNSALFKDVTGVKEDSISPIHNFLLQFQVIDILNSDADVPINRMLNGVSPIIFMLGVAVLIGFLVLLSSYLLRISTSVKRGDYPAAFGQLAWIFFISAAVSYFILSANNYTFVGQILLIIGILGLLIFNQAKSIGGKILGFLFGPRGLYGIIQMGADLMSFTRIVAIGLTGGVIASIVNLLAGILYESSGAVVGLILAILMLLVGHTFNLVLSLFGAYINPIRLTYVEFMPKFFLGEGRQIQKFNPELQHFRVVEN